MQYTKIRNLYNEDEFDLFIVPTMNRYKYQDIFTGFVFYKPLEEHFNCYGFKNIIANGFDKVILNRAILIDDHSTDLDLNIKYVKERVNKLREQEITINSIPYQKYAPVFELLFGTIVVNLGLIFGLAFFLTKNTKVHT